MTKKKLITKMINDFITRFSPPGSECKSEIRLYIVGSIISFTASLMFFASYASERSKLYDYDRFLKKYILNETATMTDFNEIMGGYLLGFALLALAMLTFVIFRYSYYRQGSKSIYLMKRLPNRAEIHKRAIPLPLLASFSCLVYAFALRLIYFVFYLILTPNKCLPAGVGEQFWRIFG